MHLTRNIFAALDVCSHPADDQRRGGHHHRHHPPTSEFAASENGVLTPAVNQSAREVWSTRRKFLRPSSVFLGGVEEFFDFVKVVWGARIKEIMINALICTPRFMASIDQHASSPIGEIAYK